MFNRPPLQTTAVWLLVASLLLAACAEAPPATVAPATDTATLPPVVAQTTATATLPPTATASPTTWATVLAPTVTATSSPTAPATRPPSPTHSATPTVAFTPTPTLTPSPRPPTAVPGPVITSFTVSPAEVDPGDTVTVAWETTGATVATLWTLLPSGQFGDFWPVPVNGEQLFTIGDSERNQKRFFLTVSAGDLHDGADAAVVIRCTGEWFFVDPPPICPGQPPQTSAAAEQHFERGVMVWLAARDQVLVLFDDGQSPHWAVYSDDWTPDMPNDDPTLIPPPGLLQPIRGFGLVWREGYGNVRERLGWALSEEVAFETLIQWTSYDKYNSTYIRARDGDVWRVLPERSGWEKLPAN